VNPNLDIVFRPGLMSFNKGGRDQAEYYLWGKGLVFEIANGIFVMSDPSCEIVSPVHSMMEMTLPLNSVIAMLQLW
jgi:hypothetical protein